MNQWKSAVTIVRADALRGKGRATAFDFAGTGGEKTWIGTVTNAPGFVTGKHHHGRHEVAVIERATSRISRRTSRTRSGT